MACATKCKAKERVTLALDCDGVDRTKNNIYKRAQRSMPQTQYIVAIRGSTLMFLHPFPFFFSLRFHLHHPVAFHSRQLILILIFIRLTSDRSSTSSHVLVVILFCGRKRETPARCILANKRNVALTAAAPRPVHNEYDLSRPNCLNGNDSLLPTAINSPRLYFAR